MTDRYLKEMLEEVIDRKLMFGQIWNINFPDCSLSEYKGILSERKASQGKIFDDSYKVIKELSDGGKRYVIDGREVMISEEGSDLRAVLDNYISIGIVNNVAM